MPEKKTPIRAKAPAKKLQPKPKGNMALWNKYKTPDTNYLRPYYGERGFVGKTIDAQYLRQLATEAFGPKGIGWGIEDVKYEIIKPDESQPLSWRYGYDALLYYKWDNELGEVAIAADLPMWEWSNEKGKPVTSVDLKKRCATAALSKGLSEIGFGADVYLGLFDGNGDSDGPGAEPSDDMPQAMPQSDPDPEMVGTVPVETDPDPEFASPQPAPQTQDATPGGETGIPTMNMIASYLDRCASRLSVEQGANYMGDAARLIAANDVAGLQALMNKLEEIANG